MQVGKADLDLRGAIFSVRLSDLVARELMLSGARFEVPRDTQVPTALPDEQDLLARAESLWQKVNADPPLPGTQDVEHSETCHAIAASYESLIEAQPANSSLRLRMQLNRAIAFLLMHSVSRADEQCTAVLSVDESHPRALTIAGRIRFYSGNLGAAKDCLTRVRGDESWAAIEILAESCVAGGDYGQANMLYGRLNENRYAFDTGVVCGRLLRVADIVRDLPAAEKLVDEIRSQDWKHPIVQLALAEHLFQTDPADDAEQLMSQLHEAKTTASNAKLWYAWQLGRMHFFRGNFMRACDWYGLVAPDESDSLPHREYVHALYRAGLLPAAHRRARAIRGKNGRVVSGITEIEADVLAQTDNFVDARNLIMELIADRPKSSHLLLSLAKLYAATGEFPKAKKCLSEIDGEQLPPELREELDSMMSVLSHYSDGS